MFSIEFVFSRIQNVPQLFIVVKCAILARAYRDYVIFMCVECFKLFLFLYLCSFFTHRPFHRSFFREIRLKDVFII